MIGTAWSQRVADASMKREPIVGDRWDYQWGVLLMGIQHVWQTTGERRYFDHIKSNVDRFVGPDGTIATYAMADANLDFVNPGKLLFPLYRETGDERYKRAALTLREQLRTQPRTASGGFWHKRVYPDQMWLDGLYMGGPFLAEYARDFDEPAGFDEVVKQLTLVFEHTRDPKTGLLYHGWDESRRQFWADPKTGCSRTFWARAIAWYAMALADVLDLMPFGEGRVALAKIFAETMEPLVRIQDGPTGMWYQVLDQGARAGNYFESSATCMFAYALAKGVRQGSLPAAHRSAAERAFRGVVDHLVRVSGDDILLDGICKGAGLSLTPDRDGSFEYYVATPIVTNDHKGVGAFLLASVELERRG